MLIARPVRSSVVDTGLNINNVAQNRVRIESTTITSKYAIRNKLMIMLISLPPYNFSSFHIKLDAGSVPEIQRPNINQ